jgi:hypothetical protein
MWYGFFVAQLDPAMPVFELQLTNFSVSVPPSFQHCLKYHTWFAAMARILLLPGHSMSSLWVL